MKTLTIRSKTIGTRRPKTIVPIVATTHAEIIAAAALLQKAPLDFVEWRADFFDHVLDHAALQTLLHELRATLQDTPLLATYRRKIEGGEGEATPSEYAAFCAEVAASGCADLLDIELSIGQDAFASILASAHNAALPVIASSHNFTTTPNAEEMVTTLHQMQLQGADIAKLAVMPQSKADVLALFAATAIMADEHPETPIVTMSMGTLGQPSRVCGASFGSAMTFASLGNTSAPGQIALPEMNLMLDALYGCG